MKKYKNVLISIFGILIIIFLLSFNKNEDLNNSDFVENPKNEINDEAIVEESIDDNEFDRDKTIVTRSSSEEVYKWARQQPYYMYETYEGEIVKKVKNPFWESDVININEDTTLREISKEEFDLYAFDLHIATEFPYNSKDYVEKLPETIEKYTKPFDVESIGDKNNYLSSDFKELNVYKFREDMDVEKDFSEFELEDYYNGGTTGGFYKYLSYSPVYDKYIFWESWYEGGAIVGVNAKNPDYPIQKLPGDAIKSPTGDKYFVVGSLVGGWMGYDYTGSLYVFSINEKGELIYDSGLKGFENMWPHGGTEYFDAIREASWLEDGSGIVWRTFDHCVETDHYGDDCNSKGVKYFLLKFN